MIHIHTYTVTYAYKYACIQYIQHGTEIQAIHIHRNPYKTQYRSPAHKAMKTFNSNKCNQACENRPSEHKKSPIFSVFALS